MHATSRLRRANFLVGSAIALLICALASRACADETVIREAWYAQYLNGAKCGYQHEQVVLLSGAGGSIYETRASDVLAVERGSIVLRTSVDAVMQEDAAGRVTAFRREVSGPMTLLIEGRREGDEFVYRSQAASGPVEERCPAHDSPGPWALEQLRARTGFAPGTQALRIFLVDAPARPVNVSLTVIGQETVDVFGQLKTLWRSDAALDVLPGVTITEWYDATGQVWLRRMTMPGNVALEGRLTTMEAATSPDEPVDLLAVSLVRVDRPIPEPRSLDWLKLRVKPLSGAIAGDLGLCGDDWQRVEPDASGGVVVTVTSARDATAPSYPLPCRRADVAGLLAPSLWMETGDARVREAAADALGGTDDALDAARRIEAFVARTIARKDLSLGFATAAETLSQKAGDCTEHAVLTAALARAAGIPSRVVAGLVYVPTASGHANGAFAYHMWTEVYAGEWLPLDAALGGHDATHVALARSDLASADAILVLSSAVSRLLGAVEIEVLDAGQDAAPDGRGNAGDDAP